MGLRVIETKKTTFTLHRPKNRPDIEFDSISDGRLAGPDPVIGARVYFFG